jgi:aromatic-L-amino-acid/L-tryptophan decarboxylase
MENHEFRAQAHVIVDWMADYLADISKYPVKSQVKPGEIYDQLPQLPPDRGEFMDDIFNDFKKLIMPGITHWQNPNFHAYFPANSSYPSILAEMITASLGAQCMKWDTSPAAAELEERVVNWLKAMTGIPDNFQGVIQDGASSATLVAILTSREKYSGNTINDNGFSSQDYRVYCSMEAHSSVEKAVKISGIGKNNLIRIPVDDEFRLLPHKLEEAIKKDINDGKKPLCVIAALGTTSSTAIDPLKPISEICEKYQIWLHVDAAYAGSALILPEFRWMIEGIEKIDSIVFNPHKWLFTNFDCSVYYVKNLPALLNTFSIHPEYLITSHQGKVNDYCDWGIPLGRRFRALKLWFVIRSYGISGLQQKLRHHLKLASEFKECLQSDGRFEILAPVTLNLICFRYNPGNLSTEDLNRINEEILTRINNSGQVYLSHTKLRGKYTMRIVIGQTSVEREHIEKAWSSILKSLPN